MGINISGVMFKSSVEDEKKFLQDVFIMANVDGHEQTTWSSIQAHGTRSREDRKKCIAIYQKGGATIIYFDLLDYQYSENVGDIYCREILKRDGGMSFTCSETAMDFRFTFYPEGKRERMTITYPETGSRRIKGKNNLNLPRGGDPIFDGLFVLQDEYVGGYEDDDVVNLYWLTDTQEKQNAKQVLKKYNDEKKQTELASRDVAIENVLKHWYYHKVELPLNIDFKEQIDMDKFLKSLRRPKEEYKLDDICKYHSRYKEVCSEIAGLTELQAEEMLFNYKHTMKKKLVMQGMDVMKTLLLEQRAGIGADNFKEKTRSSNATDYLVVLIIVVVVVVLLSMILI